MILYYAQYSSIDVKTLESTNKKVDSIETRLNTTTDKVNTIEDFLLGLNATVTTAVNAAVSGAIEEPLNNLTTKVMQLSDNMDTLTKEYEKASQFMKDVNTFITETKDKFEKHSESIDANRERIAVVENHQSFYQQLLYLHSSVQSYEKSCDDATKKFKETNTLANLFNSESQDRIEAKNKMDRYCSLHKQQLTKLEEAESSHKINGKSTKSDRSTKN